MAIAPQTARAGVITPMFTAICGYATVMYSPATSDSTASARSRIVKSAPLR